VTRILAVLGYSDRRHRGLHPIGAARLERALSETRPTDIVLLSGWSRDGAVPPEAELMAAAWTAPAAELVCDVEARTTAGTAATVASLARARGIREVVVVTSAWHAARTKLLFRGALRGAGVRLSVVPADGPRPPRALLRELVRWPLVPFQIRFASLR
jgi:uncharacterized SAM-binding protein YcdF (DUF218 family)